METMNVKKGIDENDVKQFLKHYNETLVDVKRTIGELNAMWELATENGKSKPSLDELKPIKKKTNFLLERARALTKIYEVLVQFSPKAAQ